MCKKILITGAESYIGASFEKWLKRYGDSYTVTSISVRDKVWKARDFSGYDVVLHVAAVVHKKEKPDMAKLYRKINTELAVGIAEKAKREGVRQFIFMSSMSVYGIESGTITSSTIPRPKTMYGKSKSDAGIQLLRLSDEDFKVVVLCPPLVYGHGCPGNYARLSELIRKTPVFPKVSSVRSMIYIDNLCECLRQLVDNNYSGLYFPQNKEYVNVTEMAACISRAHGKRLRLSRLLGIIVSLLPFGFFRKMFGSLTYEKAMSGDFSYCVVGFEESVMLSEAKE